MDNLYHYNSITVHQIFEILHLSKICNDHFIWILMREKMKFPLNLNCDGNVISKMDPRPCEPNSFEAY